MSILLPKVIPDNVPNVAIAQKYFWNQPSGNAFRARLQQSLQEKSLELLASRRSLVTSHDIIQLDHPSTHSSDLALVYFQKSNSSSEEKKILLLKSFSKDSEAIFEQALLLYILGHRPSRKWEGI